MATAAVPALRPLTVGQLLDQAIRVYRRNLFKFAGIVAVAQVPATLAGMLLGWLIFQASAPLELVALPGAAALASILGGLLGTGIGFVLMLTVAAAAITQATADYYLGRPTTFRNAFARAGRSWVRLLAMLLWAGLLLAGMLLWTFIPCIGSLTSYGMELFLTLAIVPIAVPVVVLEKRRGGPALRRAWDLARRRFWRVGGFTLILYLFNLLLVGGPLVLLSILLQAVTVRWIQTGAYETAFILQAAVQSLLGMAFNLLYLPLHLISMTLLYFDLRVRTEGLDLAWQTEVALRGELPAAEMLGQAPPPGRGWFLSWKEVGYFAAITVAPQLLFGVLYALLLLAFFAIRL